MPILRHERIRRKMNFEEVKRIVKECRKKETYISIST